MHFPITSHHTIINICARGAHVLRSASTDKCNHTYERTRHIFDSAGDEAEKGRGMTSNLSRFVAVMMTYLDAIMQTHAPGKRGIYA